MIASIPDKLADPISAVAAVGGTGAARKLAALTRMGRQLDAADPRVVRQAATQLVSQLFFAPMLAEVRKSSFGEKFASGGRGEEIFGEQLDQRLADVVASNEHGLTRQIVERLSRNTGAAAPNAVSAPQESWSLREKLAGLLERGADGVAVNAAEAKAAVHE